MSNKEFPPSYPHGDIEEIGSNVYMVRGSIKMNPLVRITRNMAIIKHGADLSLINPMRLDANGEAQLEKLGRVQNIIRLGSMHGIDDPYYVDRFSAKLWAQEGGTKYTEPAIDTKLDANVELPFPNSKLIVLENTIQPEAMLLVEDGPGLLLCCDAIQNYGDYSNNNLPARMIMPFIGFPKTTIVGPMWLKFMTPPGASLEAEFRKIVELKFDRLLSAHGTFLSSGAHAAVARAVDKAFAK